MPQTDMLFYDGRCALCHRTVRFVVRHDRAGTAFRFAPLQGPTFQACIPAEQRAGLPDSIVLLSADGSMFVRSNAFLHILRRLGGGWKALAGVLQIIPRPLRDSAYDIVARIRFRIFGTRQDWCPVTPPELRSRFDP